VRPEAAALILKMFEREGLDPGTDALFIDISMGAVGAGFTREYRSIEIQHGLRVVTDPRTIDNVVVDTYSISDGRNGLIFLEQGERCQS
jgi:hypothetical protein